MIEDAPTIHWLAGVIILVIVICGIVYAYNIGE